MSKLIIGLMTLSISCIGTIGYASPTTTTESPVTTQWPVTFDTLTQHVKVVFPVPSREITQDNTSNRFYAAQLMSEPDKNGVRLRETFSLVYQEQPLFSSTQTSATAATLVNQFVESLKGHKGVVVQDVTFSHQKRPSKLDQNYRIIEVTEGAFTDYYVIRIIRTGEGAVVAVQTIQKDIRLPVDWKSNQAWAFVDSLEMTGNG